MTNKKLVDGGFVLGGKLEAFRTSPADLGKILVGQAQFDALGADTIRDIFENEYAGIVVVPDKILKKMSDSEKWQYLNGRP